MSEKEDLAWIASIKKALAAAQRGPEGSRLGLWLKTAGADATFPPDGWNLVARMVPLGTGTIALHYRVPHIDKYQQARFSERIRLAPKEHVVLEIGPVQQGWPTDTQFG